jgi:broad specificity phosphatase PhoE
MLRIVNSTIKSVVAARCAFSILNYSATTSDTGSGVSIKNFKSIRINHSDINNIKIVHFIRHAEGHHNVIRRLPDKRIRLSKDYEDAHLTTKGIQQCNDFASKIGHQIKPDLVVISPMNRTIQTATFCFPHLMNKVPWIALEHIREHASSAPYNQRLPLTQHNETYGHYVDFTEIMSTSPDVDPLKTLLDTRQPKPSSAIVAPHMAEQDSKLEMNYETTEEIQERARRFLHWLSKRPEREVLVVSHARFLQELLSAVFVHTQNMDNDSAFKNCEMRSYVVLLPAAKD